MYKYSGLLMVILLSCSAMTACTHDKDEQLQEYANNDLQNTQSGLLPKPTEELTPVQARTRPASADRIKRHTS